MHFLSILLLKNYSITCDSTMLTVSSLCTCQDLDLLIIPHNSSKYIFDHNILTEDGECSANKVQGN